MHPLDKDELLAAIVNTPQPGQVLAAVSIRQPYATHPTTELIDLSALRDSGPNAGTPHPFTFRLPLAGGLMGYGTERTWQAHSACGQYQISVHLRNGNRKPGITHWGFETRVDSAGHSWTNTSSCFVTDNFGNLVEVPA